MASTDFLEVEAILISLLEAAVGPTTASAANILSADQIKGEHDLTEYCPGVVVQFDAAQANPGEFALAFACDQSWQCVVIVDALKTAGQRAAELAGPIIAAILDAVHGYEISDGRHLICVGIDQSFARDGYAEYPLNFTVAYAQAAGATETL